jgi:hypothetical protein
MLPDMKDWVRERIENLKSPGFADAGLYDPPWAAPT